MPDEAKVYLLSLPAGTTGPRQLTAYLPMGGNANLVAGGEGVEVALTEAQARDYRRADLSCELVSPPAAQPSASSPSASPTRITTEPEEDER